VGSGPGGSPIANEMARAGHEVVVLEKGPWIKREHFNKDQIAVTRRDIYSPRLDEEFHVREEKNDAGEWVARDTLSSRQSLWNGSAVGGSSNFMSGYFHRLKPNDFRLLSTYGPIDGANVADWPISYNDLEPYYTKVEQVVGISGKVRPYTGQEPRSTPDFPFPALATNKAADWIEEAGAALGYEMMDVPRAIISRPLGNRLSCYYSNFCGSYGCSSGAKSSAREALLNDAVATGKCTIIANAHVVKLETNEKGKVVRAHYIDKHDGNQKKFIEADVFVVACQAIETTRLLLLSSSLEFPHGLANHNGMVGQNLLFAGGGAGSGYLHYKNYSEDDQRLLRQPGLFVNKGIPQWYEINDPEFAEAPAKGGMIEFMFEHANGMMAFSRYHSVDGNLTYGTELKRKIYHHYNSKRRLRFEIFADWLPTADTFVSLDPSANDKFGNPVARVKIGGHPHDIKVGKYLAAKAATVLEKLGATGISTGITSDPPTNLQAGGCRFGNDDTVTVLDKFCRAHSVDNLYVTDGSFMPTGGSATFTWTIYANSFRVADHLLARYATA
jgi:choline dehydrogenase-like flavoprotein